MAFTSNPVKGMILELHSALATMVYNAPIEVIHPLTVTGIAYIYEVYALFVCASMHPAKLTNYLHCLCFQELLNSQQHAILLMGFRCFKSTPMYLKNLPTTTTEPYTLPGLKHFVHGKMHGKMSNVT